MKKRIAIAAGGLILLTAVYLLARGETVDVTAAVVGRDTLSVTIPAEGRTRARERFTVAAPISGRLTRLDVKEGDTVQEGQLLGHLFPAPEDPRVIATARAEVGAAEARHQEAEAHLREAGLQAVQAQREVERRRPLLEIGAITQERLEQAELAAVVARERRQSAGAGLATAAAALEAARARLLGAESADHDVRPVDVTAPVRGRVLEVPEPSERVVLAGSPLVVLADTDGLELVLDVLSEDAVQVHPGDPVVITAWGGAKPLSGEVRNVTFVGYTKVSALGVEEQRVDVVADLYHAPSTLGTGYRVSGEIVVWSGTDILSVPTSTLFRMGESWQLFAVVDGSARRRKVVLGHRNEWSAEVVEGVSEGDAVILFPPEGVEDGVRVRVAGEP